MADDLCRALVYIRDHIHEHYPNADPSQIFLSGHSAGGHLVSLLVLDSSHFLRHNFDPESIRGVITISGIYTLTNPVHDSKNHINNLMFRLLYSSNLSYPEGRKIHDFSPIEHIKEDQNLPPFLVMSARFDMGLELDAKRFVGRLQQFHHQVDYHIIRGTTHGTIASKFSKNDARQHFFSFIRQNLK